MKTKNKTVYIVIVKSLVVNSKKDILFVKRNWKERPDVHGKWELPGGQLEFKEQPEQAAKREAKEESGYDVEVKAMIPKSISFSRTMDGINKQLTIICYLCLLKGGKKSTKDHGVSDVQWFSIKNMPKESDCLSGTYDFLNAYKKMDKCK
jgi:8-oxo-dGTP diphosphatase